MPEQPTVVFAGSGAFGLPTLRALGDRVAHVYTQPDAPAGRGKKLTPTPIGRHAEEAGLPLTKTPDLNAEAIPQADALVVIAFGQKIDQAVADAPPLGAINLHASLLPRHRGAAPIHHALLAGDAVTGNSVIRLARRMDAGAVLGMSARPIGPSDTTGELHDALAEDGAPLVRRVLDDLAAGTATALRQDGHLATRAGKLSRADAVLDFARPAFEVARRVNGLSPWPGCRVEVGGQALTLLRARRVKGAGEPGVIAANGTVGCGADVLEVLEVQPAGGKPMPLAAYRNGRPWEAGSTVASR